MNLSLGTSKKIFLLSIANTYTLRKQYLSGKKPLHCDEGVWEALPWQNVK